MWKRKLMIGMIFAGAALLFLDTGDLYLSMMSEREPRQLTCRQLHDEGYGDNAHVVVADGVLDVAALVATDRGSTRRGPSKPPWTRVWIPLRPPGHANSSTLERTAWGDGVRVLLFSEAIPDEEALAAVVARPALHGSVVTSIHDAHVAELAKLRAQLGGIELERVHVLELDRTPRAPWRAWLWVILGVTVAFLAAGWLYVDESHLRAQGIPTGPVRQKPRFTGRPPPGLDVDERA